MNKRRFLHILNRKLRKIPREEREQALAFYAEYLADADDEKAAIAALPHPKQIAAKIIVEVGQRETSIPIITIILAICSAPVTIPLALSLIAVALALLIVFITLILVPYIVLGSLLLSSLPMAIATVPAFLWDFETGLVFLGMTICCFSFSSLGLMGFHKLAKLLFGAFRRLFLKLGKRSYQHEA